MTPIAWTVVAVPVLGAALCRGAAARTIAAGVALLWLGVAVSLAALGWVEAPASLLLPTGALVALAAILVVPHRDASAPALARLLATGGLLAGVILAEGALLVALWAASSVPVWLELRGRAREDAQVFAIHLGVSTLLLAASVSVTALSGWSVPLLLIAVLVREGIVPFHAWVPVLYRRAPLGLAAVFTSGQVGAVLLGRHLDAVQAAGGVLAGVGLVTALYGAAMATIQQDARSVAGYLVVSQSALVLAGFEDQALLGRTGGVLAIVAVALATSAFVLALAATEARRGELSLARFSGGHDETPWLAGLCLIAGLAAVGVPGSLGFVAEDLVFHATLAERPWVGLAMITATAINGVTILRCTFRLFAGADRERGTADVRGRERLGLAGLVLVVFALGLAPSWIVAHAATTFDEPAAQSK